MVGTKVLAIGFIFLLGISSIANAARVARYSSSEGSGKGEGEGIGYANGAGSGSGSGTGPV
jgi:hypothetical protein